MPVKVDIGIACNKWQSPSWWSKLMAELLTEQLRGGVTIGRIHAISSATPDHNKNYIIDDKRRSKTDINRNVAAGGFLHGDSDWLWWIDDDTVPPKGALSHLLSLDKPAAALPYVMAKPPHNPIAYMRNAEGLYAALWEFPNGGILTVDSVGMGCTLTHRSVFEKIQSEFVAFQRPTGSLYPVHKSRIDAASLPEATAKTFVGNRERVHLMELITPLSHPAPDDPRPFPFFAMEYGRTEDHYFWELAEQVGVKPVLDTAHWCRHIRDLDYGQEHYEYAKAALAAEREQP